MPQESLDSSSPDPVERRRDKRYRIKERLLISAQERTDLPVTSEISISGLSAATDGVLQVDDEADLSPVVDEQISAIVRRKAGIFIGFEFTNVPDDVVEAVHVLPSGLVPF